MKLEIQLHPATQLVYTSNAIIWEICIGIMILNYYVLG